MGVLLTDRESPVAAHHLNFRAVDGSAGPRVAQPPCVRGAFLRYRYRVLVTLLVSAVACTTVGCNGQKPSTGETVARYGQDLRDAVTASVPDETRRTKLLDIVDQVEALQNHFSQETRDFVTSYRKLNVDYDAERPAFDQLFADYNTKRVNARTQALALHFRMASLASDGEWRAIAKAESKLYEKSIEARQSGGDLR